MDPFNAIFIIGQKIDLIELLTLCELQLHNTQWCFIIIICPFCKSFIYEKILDALTESPNVEVKSYKKTYFIMKGTWKAKV